MKKLLLIALLVLSSCHTTKFVMGMTVTEFTQLNHNAVFIEGKAGGYYVYSCNTHNNSINQTLFYYFVNGKLAQVDPGMRSPDVIIDQTVHNQ